MGKKWNKTVVNAVTDVFGQVRNQSRGGFIVNTFAQGQHNCYVCGSEMLWQANLNGRTATYDPYTVAQVIAVDNGVIPGKGVERVILEVVVRCKSCEVQNKFTYQHQLLENDD
jgi:hypothetical protein